MTRTKIEDHLARAIKLHATADGAITFDPVYEETGGGHCGDWRDIAIDALISGDTTRAAIIIDTNRGDSLGRSEEHAASVRVISLPVFSTDTIAEARTLRAMFCRLERPITPNMQYRDAVTRATCTKEEHVYRLSRFEPGSLEDLFRVQAEMAKAYEKLRMSELRKLVKPIDFSKGTR